MLTYVVRRLLLSLIVVILVSVLVFSAMRLLPGDPIYMLFNPNQLQSMTAEQLAMIRHEAGLDRPLVVQYFSWIGGVLHGDLGKSIMSQTPISVDLGKRIPVTAYLGIWAFAIGTCIGIPLGIVSAVRRGTWLDTLVTTIANLGITIPTFWLGIMLIWVFAVQLHWLPVSGFTSPFSDFVLSTRKLIMPVFCLSVFPLAAYARQARSSMLEVLRQDYIRTAWSKGLQEKW
jgi:peptide/nickel transport system permease protein